jgi:hypothetical protein
MPNDGSPVLRRKTGRKLRPGIDPSIGKPTQFKPGQSGNPGGRPRKFVTLLSDVLREKLGSISIEDEKPYACALVDELVDKMLAQVKKGRAIKEVLMFLNIAADRTEGKPAQKVTISRDPGSCIPGKVWSAGNHPGRYDSVIQSADSS